MAFLPCPEKNWFSLVLLLFLVFDFRKDSNILQHLSTSTLNILLQYERPYPSLLILQERLKRAALFVMCIQNRASWGEVKVEGELTLDIVFMVIFSVHVTCMGFLM